MNELSEIKVTDLKRVALKEGDVLLVRVPVPASMPATRTKEWFDSMRTTFKDVFPNNKVVIIDERADISIITKELE